MRLRLVLALATTLVFGSLAAADLTITFNATGKGGGGTEVHYYTSAFHMVRNETQKRDNLVDFKEGVTYSIDHKKKVISKISFDDAMAALEALNTTKTEGLGGMMGAMFGDPNDWKVEQQGTETILGRTCQKSAIKVGKLSMVLSADPTLKMPMPDAAYAKMMKSQAAQFTKMGPMGASFKKLYEEMAKIKGVPLKTHMTGMMGMDNTTEATKIDQSPIPAATFVLPTGYKLEDEGKKLKDGMKGK